MHAGCGSHPVAIVSGTLWLAVTPTRYADLHVLSKAAVLALGANTTALWCCDVSPGSIWPRGAQHAAGCAGKPTRRLGGGASGLSERNGWTAEHQPGFTLEVPNHAQLRRLQCARAASHRREDAGRGELLLLAQAWCACAISRIAAHPPVVPLLLVLLLLVLVWCCVSHQEEYELAPSAEEAFTQLAVAAADQCTGNARSIRNLLQRVILNQSSRVAALPSSKRSIAVLKTIEGEDITSVHIDSSL